MHKDDDNTPFSKYDATCVKCLYAVCGCVVTSAILIVAVCGTICFGYWTTYLGESAKHEVRYTNTD